MSQPTRVPPVAWFVGGLAAQQLVAWRKRRKQRKRAEASGQPIPERNGSALACGKAAASIAFVAAGANGLVQAGTTVDPEHPERATSLVTTGIYALSRNPIYLGLAGLLAANALRHRSFTAGLVVPAYLAAIDQTQIPAEEAALKKQFGRAWSEYAARVPRWILVHTD